MLAGWDWVNNLVCRRFFGGDEPVDDNDDGDGDGKIPPPRGAPAGMIGRGVTRGRVLDFGRGGKGAALNLLDDDDDISPPPPPPSQGRGGRVIPIATPAPQGMKLIHYFRSLHFF